MTLSEALCPTESAPVYPRARGPSAASVSMEGVELGRDNAVCSVMTQTREVAGGGD